jgi:hypothetical protein
MADMRLIFSTVRYPNHNGRRFAFFCLGLRRFENLHAEKTHVFRAKEADETG